MLSPAFAGPVALRPRAPSTTLSSPYAATCTATQPSSTSPSPSPPQRSAPAPARTLGGAKRVATVRAPVIDTRVAYVHEAHHWMAVGADSRAQFERAAVAQADFVRVVEREVGGGALHRWVLRAVDDPLKDWEEGESGGAVRRYVVMETYKGGVDGDLVSTGGMDRWLGGIRAAGETLDCSVTATLRYANLFTSKLHGAEWDVNDTVIVVESVQAEDGAGERLREALESNAEASVAARDCLEFCVLEAVCKQGLFKTIEVYRDVGKLRKHMEGLDGAYVEASAALVAGGGRRARDAFKPVVFS